MLDSVPGPYIGGHNNSMATQSLDSHIVATHGTLGGKVRIAGCRISVEDIAIWHLKSGKTVDEICAEYDLSLAEVLMLRSRNHHDHQACRDRAGYQRG